MDIARYFKRLDFEPEIARIYMALYTHGAQTLSELARSSGVERTRIYRLLDTIEASGLVEVETDYKRHLYRAAPISNLQLLLNKKEQDLKQLQNELHALESAFAQTSLSSPASRVQFYRGAEGAKQMFWNETKASNSIDCILDGNIQSKTGDVFFQRWVARMNQRDIKTRGIINSRFVSTQQSWYNTHQNERLAFWESRIIDEATYPILHSVLIYDNVIAYFNWKAREIFGIEIYNQQIADSQRKLFTLLWEQATPINDLTGEKVIA